MNFFTHKLISFLVLALIGISYVIYRRIMSVSDRRSVNRLIISISTYNRKAKQFAETLDMPYGKKIDFVSEDFEKLKVAIQAVTGIDDYIILYHASIDTFRYLIITEVRFSDFDIGVRGEATDVDKVAYHSFVLHFDPNAKTLSVFSDLYTDTTSKFQKEAFSRGIRGI